MNNCYILHFYDGLDEMDLNHQPVPSTDTSVIESESGPYVIIKFYHFGEWSSGLRRCDQNRKVPGSNPTRHSAGL